jgi:hypothetical protein
VRAHCEAPLNEVRVASLINVGEPHIDPPVDHIVVTGARVNKSVGLLACRFSNPFIYIYIYIYLRPTYI